jgi:biopolymer transport protein ExbD
MARKRRKQEVHAGELNLTAMIDVAFQLLNFFVITSHPVNVYANLDVFRPQAEKMITKQEEQPQDLLEIVVYKDGYMLKGRRVSVTELDRMLTKIASYSTRVSVIIKCTGDSTHAGLVNVLDLCAKSKLSMISVFSM